jgi:hypothetical protein
MHQDRLASIFAWLSLILIGAGLYLLWGLAVTLLFAGVVCLALFTLLALQPPGAP